MVTAPTKEGGDEPVTLVIRRLPGRCESWLRPDPRRTTIDIRNAELAVIYFGLSPWCFRITEPTGRGITRLTFTAAVRPLDQPPRTPVLIVIDTLLAVL